MPQKNIFNLWKETISAKHISKDTFKSMHLVVLHQAIQQKQTEQLFLIQFEIQDFVLYESKGYLQSITNLIERYSDLNEEIGNLFEQAEAFDSNLLV